MLFEQLFSESKPNASNERLAGNQSEFGLRLSDSNESIKPKPPGLIRNQHELLRQNYTLGKLYSSLNGVLANNTLSVSSLKALFDSKNIASRFKA